MIMSLPMGVNSVLNLYKMCVVILKRKKSIKILSIKKKYLHT